MLFSRTAATACNLSAAQNRLLYGECEFFGRYALPFAVLFIYGARLYYKRNFRIRSNLGNNIRAKICRGTVKTECRYTHSLQYKQGAQHICAYCGFSVLVYLHCCYYRLVFLLAGKHGGSHIPQCRHSFDNKHITVRR